MGNNQSRSSAPHSPAQAAPHHTSSAPSQSYAKEPQHGHTSSTSHRKEPRRRESVQALQSGIVAGSSSGKAAPAAPAASLASATGTAEYKSHSSTQSARVTGQIATN